MASGKFITFEGGEGSGKSTQVSLLADRLRAEGLDVVVTREPGGSPFAEALRALLLDPDTPPHSPLSEALLFYAARADHLDKTIRPALATGQWVISDRFSDSTRVYQGVGGGLPDALFDALDAAIVAPTVPDLTIILDLSADIGLSRAARRREAEVRVLQHANDDEKVLDPGEGGATRQMPGSEPDAYERRALAFHERLRQGFVELAKREPQRCVLIATEGGESDVAGRVWTLVRERLLPAGGS